MALPRKNTRHLSIDGITYLWHLDKDWDVHNRWLVVQRDDCAGGQLLMIDPYHHDFLPSRGAISRAVRFALDHGWNPDSKGAPVRLSFAGRERGFRLATPEPNPQGRANGRQPSGSETNRTPAAAASRRSP
jgi:hypothetical protein